MHCLQLVVTYTLVYAFMHGSYQYTVVPMHANCARMATCCVFINNSCRWFPPT